MNVLVRLYRGCVRWMLGLPIEFRIALVFSGMWLVGVMANLPISIPRRGNAISLELQFAGPVFLAALFQLLLTPLLVARRWRRSGRDAFIMVKLSPLIALSVFLYYNFKAWMPFVNPRLYDAEFYYLDQLAAPLLTSFFSAREAVANNGQYNVDIWYSVCFVTMFFLSLAMHAVLDTPQHQRQLVLGMCLILLFGGVSYWVTPAEGPFLYRDGPNAVARKSQEVMHLLFQEVRVTRELPPGYFTSPLGAMPSLHVAFALFFTLWAARSVRALLIPYGPILLWTVIEAAVSGWHYLIDLPAGALLAVGCYALAIRCLRT